MGNRAWGMGHGEWEEAVETNSQFPIPNCCYPADAFPTLGFSEAAVLPVAVLPFL